MADKSQHAYLEMKIEGKESLGTIEVASEVLEVIAGIATTDIDGVAGTRGTFATDVAEKLGKKMHGKGIRTEWLTDGLYVDIYCVIKFGYSIPTVAKQVQTQVRQAIQDMTSLETKEVNVHVAAIHFDQSKEQIEQ